MLSLKPPEAAEDESNSPWKKGRSSWVCVKWASVLPPFVAGADLVASPVSGLSVLIFEPQVRAMAGLTAKITWEQLVGPTAATQAALGGAIAVGAHLYGSPAGLPAALSLGPSSTRA